MKDFNTWFVDFKKFSDLCLCFSSASSCNNVSKWLSSISLTFELMNPHDGMNDNSKKDGTKATAAIPMAGAIVTAALLLSGLSLISSYQPVLAQQNMTGANQTAGGNVTGGNVTGGNVTGGNVTGGNVTGGNVTGGNVTGGNQTAAGGTDGGTTGGGGPLEGIFGGGGGG
jgi:hypothetical protein